LIIALIIGAVTGWLMSMPIGPVNAAAISRTLKYSYKYGVAVGVGAALMDIIYCAGAAQINQFLTESPIINLLFEITGFCALLILGIRQLRARQVRVELPQLPEEETSGDRMAAAAMQRMNLEKKSLVGPFIIGVLLYATNVMAVPEWIIIAGLWRGWGVLGNGFDVNLMFAIGAGVGTLGWYIVLIRWIENRQAGFNPETLRKINLGTSIAMLVFAGYFAYAIIFETHWDQVRLHVKDNTKGYININ
jgi:L-lysine exporter family protein LysE/ArgO